MAENRVKIRKSVYYLGILECEEYGYAEQLLARLNNERSF